MKLGYFVILSLSHGEIASEIASENVSENVSENTENAITEAIVNETVVENLESWSQWTDCSKKCGGGMWNRTRTCEEGNLCSGKNTEEVDCNQQPCQWEDWLPWSECTKKCGGGIKNRTRECEEEKECVGNSTEEKNCNLRRYVIVFKQINQN